MTGELYKFLKGKGLEFCYKEKTPFLVNSWVHYEYCEQFAEHQNKELIEERKSHAISFAVYYDFNDFNDTDTVGYLYNEWIKTNKK